MLTANVADGLTEDAGLLYDHSGRWPMLPMLPSCSSQAQHVDMLGGGCVETRRPKPLGARVWWASGFRLELIANSVLDTFQVLRSSDGVHERLIAAKVGPIYLGIAAISPLIPTKAIIRLML
jgi:hypothetical protein